MSGALISTDLGCSSKKINEKFITWRKKGFHINIVCMWVSR